MSELHEVLQSEVVRGALSELDDIGAVERLYNRDATLVGDDPDAQASFADRLGWLDATDDAEARVARLQGFTEAAASDGLERVVLAGMGGSSLAPEVFSRVFDGHARGATLEVLDSTHPDAVRAVLDQDLSRTLVLVSSKSGSTEETRCFSAYAGARLPSSAQLTAITDEGSALAEQAASQDWREVFLNPSDIGGRYSALSWFGMVPAALLGIDVAEVWRRGARVLDISGPGAEHKPDQGRQPGVNPAAPLAAFMAGHARQGRNKLTLLAARGVEAFGDWAEQLVAESLGKRGTGVIPVVGEPVGRAGSYGDDRAFVELRLAGDRAPGAEVLEAAGHPVLSLDLADRLDVGAQFVLWELAVALAGVLLEVNPFDEPNVTESKSNTKAILDGLEMTPLPEPEDGDLQALFTAVQPGDYVSVQAYLPPGEEVRAGLVALQGLIRDRLQVAVTAGVGPRFLHSTGQLHKGGPASIVALQIVDGRLWEDTPPAAAIPGRPYDFGTLIRAQAVGDLRSLRDHDRRAVQVVVDGPGALGALVDRARAALV